MIKMIRLAVTGTCLLFFMAGAQAQKPDTLIKKLDSLRKSNDTTGKQINNTAPQAFNESTVLTFPGYFILLGSNAKQSFTKPFRMKKKDWRNLLIFAVAEAALTRVDEPIQRWAVDLRNNNPTVSGVSKYVTQFGGLYEVYTLSALMAEGLIFKNQKLKTTTLLATQSYLTAGAVQFVGKFLSGRQRPSYADNYTLDAEPSFHGPFYKLIDANGNRSNSSFPSGHTTAAFAAATVYSLEYKDKKLVPWISYGVATLIGLSRITENKHWFTDVVAGAALGYLTGVQVVNNYHRYAKIRSGEIQEEKKGSLSFNVGYVNGVVMPGLVYQFR
ncbi:MAG: phosphatase PAP2 family protein [Chitinophagaceae bacterium]|nr:phosphatase PAP2 family protein [Chitinophagaceae bacterium]